VIGDSDRKTAKAMEIGVQRRKPLKQTVFTPACLFLLVKSDSTPFWQAARKQMIPRCGLFPVSHLGRLDIA
jgi:hypothetical protein